MELSTELKQRIQNLLEKVPSLRDNDLRLIANIWVAEIGGKEKAHKITAHDFLEKYSKGSLTNPESVRRLRQKIQEENPLLRGNLYEKRQKHANSIKNQIKS